jgi:hypothetical protein
MASNMASNNFSSSGGIFSNLKNKLLDLIPNSTEKSNTRGNYSTQLNKDTFGSTIGNIQNKVIGEDNSIAANYMLILAFTLAFLIIILLYFFSNSYRTSNTLDYIGMYYQYQAISSYPISTRSSKLPLSDCYVSSSYNSALVQYQIFDYTNELILKAILKAGVRYIEFNIFNNEFGINSIPVVSNGYKQGEWKLTFNVLSFELICSIIAENAFTLATDNSAGVPNPTDPLFIGLNLNTNNNIYCLDKVADHILFYFRKRLLTTRYTYQQSNLAKAPLSDLINKVVIIASTGYQGSKLEELINGSWDLDNIRRVHYSVFNDNNLDTNNWIEYNKRGLTIVVPHTEGDFWTQNYDPIIPWRCGCQFVAMNFQVVDTPMDTYITQFKNHSIYIKATSLRAPAISATVVTATPDKRSSTSMLIIQPEPTESADDSWVEDLSLVPTTPPPAPTTPPPTPFEVVLNTGECMANKFVTSPNGKYKAWQQSDGHFVLYNTVTNKPIWSTGSFGKTNGKLCMQTDGNLVNYTSNGIGYWNSKTNTGNNYQLIIKDDGDLVIRDSVNGNVKWSSNTGLVTQSTETPTQSPTVKATVSPTPTVKATVSPTPTPKPISNKELSDAIRSFSW